MNLDTPLAAYPAIAFTPPAPVSASTSIAALPPATDHEPAALPRDFDLVDFAWHHMAVDCTLRYGATGDRSEDFWAVVRDLKGQGWSPGNIEALFRLPQYFNAESPRAPVAKYADRLRAQIEDCFNKVGAAKPALLVAPALDAIFDSFRPWQTKDLSKIPPPRHVYGTFLTRGYTSLTVAPPKVGKSRLGELEAVDIATGRGILTDEPPEPLKVAYWNKEDDQNTVDRNIGGILTHYGIPQEEIAGRLWAISGIEHSDFALIRGQKEPTIDEAAFQRLEAFCLRNAIDVLILDPLQDFSHASEANDAFRLLGGRLRQLASRTGMAIHIIHHTRKLAPGNEATIDDARGGSALRGTVRSSRVLTPMTKDEATQAGVEDHRYFFRISDGEGNLAPPSADINRWFEKKSVLIPMTAESVGVVVPWKWPDAFDGISLHHAASVREAIAEREVLPRYDSRATDWVGKIIGEVVGLNPREKAGKARIAVLLDRWIQHRFLTECEIRDRRQGRPVSVVRPGPNDPLLPPGASTGGDNLPDNSADEA